MAFQYKVLRFEFKLKGLSYHIDETLIEQEINKLAKEDWKLTKILPQLSGYGITVALLAFFEKEV